MIAIQFTCDKCGVVDSMKYNSSIQATSDAMRTERGWMRVANKNFCPTCRKIIEEAMKETRNGNKDKPN